MTERGSGGSVPQATVEPIAAPWLWSRRLLRSMMSYRQASDLGDRFVRLAPQPLQRAFERQFDFPVPRPVRASPLLFIRIPKAASVSLSLQVYGRVSHIPHRTAAFYRAADPGFYAAATTFAVVRDPWERARSAFDWLRGRGNDLAAPDRRARRAMSKVASFESFVLDVLLPAAEAGSLGRLDPVLHRQSDYVCDGEGRLLVDHTFHLERMDEVQTFLRANGVGRGEAHVNASPGGDGAAAVAMTPDVARAIGIVYAPDVDLFGYGADRRRDPSRPGATP